MKQGCIDLVGAILGRAPMPKESAALEDNVKLQMRLLATKDPAAWRAMTQTQRYTNAARAAAEDLIAQVKKKQQRVALTIAKHDEIANYVASQVDKLGAVSRLLDFDTSKGGFTSAASQINAIQKETFGSLMDLWNATNPKIFGLFENANDMHALIKELWGEDSGNAAAKGAAKVWKQTMDELRDRFNAAGGDVGKLDEWHYPQSHSMDRIGKAGFDKWISDLIPWLDRKKYIRPDGQLMNDGEVRSLMGGVFDSITTDGQNKLDTTRPQGYGIQSNRGSEHRAVFFKDAQSYMDYQGAYGDKSLWNTLTGHVRNLGRDIGMAEVLGPDPEATFGHFNQKALLEAMRSDRANGAKLARDAKFNDRLFDYVSGKVEVVDPKLAQRAQAFRNFMTATKLPKVVITALGDEAGMAATALANKVPYGETFMREMATLNPARRADRMVLESNGLGNDRYLSSLNRFGQEEYSSGWTGKLASFVMHASGAERMWDARRQAMGSMLMSYIAKAVKEHGTFGELNDIDHGMLARKGISETDWKVWQMAEPEMFGDSPIMTPKAIRAIPDEQLAKLGDPMQLRRQASTHLLAHVLEEAGMGAMDTGPRQRVHMQAGTSKGTVGGELTRSVLLFKSFAASMMMKHWMRAASMPGMGSKFAYFSLIGLYGTFIAAVGNQIRNVILGKDPENMASAKFWGAAIMRGGGLGFFGDFFYDEFTQHDTSIAAALGGPMLTTAEDIWKLTGGAASKASKGERVDEAANLIRFTKGNTPILNLWYTQAAMDHILWNQMQEAANPGYLDRMQAKAEATHGTSWYWNPQESTPSRAPDVSLAHLIDTQRGSDELAHGKDILARTVGIE